MIYQSSLLPLIGSKAYKRPIKIAGVIRVKMNLLPVGVVLCTAGTVFAAFDLGKMNLYDAIKGSADELVGISATTQWEPLVKEFQQLVSDKDSLLSLQDGLLMGDRRKLRQMLRSMARIGRTVISKEQLEGDNKIVLMMGMFGSFFMLDSTFSSLGDELVKAEFAEPQSERRKRIRERIRHFDLVSLVGATMAATTLAEEIIKPDDKLKSDVFFNKVRGNAEQRLFDYMYDGLGILSRSLTSDVNAKNAIKKMQEKLPNMRRTFFTEPTRVLILFGSISAGIVVINILFMFLAN